MLKRSLTILLILIVAIIPAMAFAADAAPAVAAFETPQPDSSQKPVYQDPAQQQSGNSANPMKDNSQQLLLQTINGLSSYYSNYLKNQGVDWVANTDFSLSFNNLWLWNNPTFRATSLQPFKRTFSFEDKSLPFWQVSAAYENTSFTGNFGIGYRGLNESRTQMYGVNLFYDALWANNTYQAPNGYSNYKAADSTPVHQRVGVGLEYFLYALELRANGYYAVSSDQLLGTAYQTSSSANTTTPWNFYERAANGYDVSLSYQLPYMPWLKANVAGYQYFTNSPTGSSTQEQAYRGNLNGLYVGGTVQLSPRLAIDGGYDNGGTGSGFVKATYNMLAMPQPSLFWADETINDYSKYNVSNKMLNKVQRNNNITTVTYAKYGTASSLGGVVTVVVKDYAGNPQKNVPVILANSDYSVAVADQTDSSGQVTFSGLPANGNSSPSDLNAKFAAARATGAASDTVQSYSYYVAANVKNYSWTPGGGWSDYEILNTVNLSSSNAANINVSCQPQPSKSGGDQPAPDIGQSTPAATTLTVTVNDELSNPVDLSAAANSIAAAAGAINSNGGSGVKIDDNHIVKTQLAQGIIKINCSNGQAPDSGSYVNYGSGLYGVTFTLNGMTYGISQSVTIGANATAALCVKTNSPDLDELKVYFKGRQVKGQPFVLTNTIQTSEGATRDVYIAAATAVDLAQPFRNTKKAKAGNGGDPGVAVFSGTNAIKLTSSTLAAVAYYYKDGNISNESTDNIAVLGADPNIAINNNNTAVSSISQFPFDIGN